MSQVLLQVCEIYGILTIYWIQKREPSYTVGGNAN